MLVKDTVDSSSSSLARKALLHAATLALAGTAVGGIAISQKVVTGIEALLILSGILFSAGILVTMLVFRKVAIQTVATASTAYYAVYLCAGVLISILGSEVHASLFIYLVWFFPLLVFNKMVNSPAVGRFLAKVVLVAPLVILVSLLSRVAARPVISSLYLAIVFCLSYICFALMLNAVTQYREVYIVERERAESMRIESEVLESISDCFISLDSAFKLVYLNDAACAEFGVKRRAALNGVIPSAVPGFFSHSMVDQLQAASSKASASTFEAQNEGQGLWYSMRCYPKPGGMSVHFRNITESVFSRRELEAANNRMREQAELLDNARDAIFVQDMDSRIVYWNKGAERLLGWTAAEVMGWRVGEIFTDILADVKNVRAHVLQYGEWTGELSKRHKDGRSLMLESRCTLVRGKDGLPRSILAINTDITHRKEAEARIHQLAFFDVLTGLPNRAFLRERLERALTMSPHPATRSALLLIDLDDFKTLNDTAGHDIGDLLLQEVATRLTCCLRKTDSVARFGGDEFMVMLEGLSADAETAGIEAKRVAEGILRACRQPYLLGTYEYDGTTSIGVTLFDGSLETSDDLLKRADLAMYRAKALGRNTMCFFDPAMESSLAARAALLADLKRAMQNREFELHYQPQLDRDGRVTGAEALLRWPHAQRGMVPPNEFIPVAEAGGLIVDLGLWVLETACAQLAQWARQPGMQGLSLAVNVSIRQFLDSRFTQRVEKVLRESGANPRLLKLEITESFMMEKANETIAIINALKMHGVGFSLDDFGTGYSSLSQLKKLPLDQLKIDQSFVRDVLNGLKEASIVRSVIALGRSLNLMVIAEGVETEEQRSFLESLGCFAYQGFLFSRALPAAKFYDFVAQSRQMKEMGAA
jgi:diguanylate cyclase (GGDEF)-like protein/PAS domain S-box-containing protein